MKHNVLCLKDICLNHILDGISLEVAREDHIMLIGANGSGKSSLLKVITGEYVPTHGSISFLEKPLIKTSIRKRASLIASMSQDPNLTTFSELSVYENYLIVGGKSSRQEAAGYVEPFNPKLAEKLDAKVSTLSGGERQALGLALCLQQRPELVVLDEHTSALDPVSAHRLMKMTMHALLERKGCAIICTHNLEDALRYGNRLIAMKKGKIILDLKGEEKRRISKEALQEIYYARTNDTNSN